MNSRICYSIMPSLILSKYLWYSKQVIPHLPCLEIIMVAMLFVFVLSFTIVFLYTRCPLCSSLIPNIIHFSVLTQIKWSFWTNCNSFLAIHTDFISSMKNKWWVKVQFLTQYCMTNQMDWLADGLSPSFLWICELNAYVTFQTHPAFPRGCKLKWFLRLHAGLSHSETYNREGSLKKKT